MKKYRFLLIVMSFAFTYHLSAQSEKAINLYTQGNQFLQTASYTEAFNAFDQAVKLSPDVFPFLYNRGTAALMLHKDDIAIADFKKATSLDPTSEDAFIGLGKSYVDARRYAEAVTAFEKALALNPKNADIMDEKAMLWSLPIDVKMLVQPSKKLSS